MATTTTPARHTFFVYAPDKTDEGATERRLAVREQHLANADRDIKNGTIRAPVGGALLTPESLTGDSKKMIGSMVIYEAETIEEVRRLVEADIYYTAGVWDPERLVILPFIPARPFY
ncbi:YCII domain-containing protein [Favolaschia claudopus]|uniref:YCII domain-containing protein n=1 Tax=Favolaschia claudopus TaxID=2862362 RepID=A0AAW0AZN8_9AGAR